MTNYAIILQRLIKYFLHYLIMYYMSKYAIIHHHHHHHHHHRCSALRQVPDTHSLHSFLPSALLFIYTNEHSIRSSIIPLLGLPRGLFPNILPSNTSLSSPSQTKPRSSVVGVLIHDRKIASSNPAQCYLVSPFRKEN